MSIRADQLQPGDVVEYDGQFHSVSQVERRPGWAWPIAADDHGWAMALGDRLVYVLRQAS